MKKSGIILTTVFLSIASMVNYMHASPAGESLDPVRKEITEKFIEISSESVAQDFKRDDQRPVSVKFQEYLERNEKATKVFQVYQSGTGEFSMQVINLEDEINKKFKEKTDELNGVNTAAIKKEIGAKALFGVGMLMVASGINVAIFGNGAIGGGLGVAGASAAIGGCTLWSRSLENQHNSRVHIEQNISMHEKWRNKFYESKKARPKN